MKRWQRAVAGTAVVGLAAGCSSAHEAGNVVPDLSVVGHSSQPPETTLYLPTWLSPDEYQRIAALPLQAAGVSVELAFAEPTADAVAPPPIPDGVVDVIGHLAANADVSVAIGGYGDQASRRPILQGFDAQAKDPGRFAGQVSAMAAQVGRRIGRPVNGFDIDWEYVKANQAQEFSDMLGALDAKFPHAALSVAVPAQDNLEGFTAAIGAIAQHVGTVHVMTYDQVTPL